MLRAVSRFVEDSSRTLLGYVAVLIVTVCAFGILVLLGLGLTGANLSPYVGILTYMVLPAGFVLGLLLLALARARVRRAEKRGQLLRRTYDLSNPRDRERLLAVAVLTAANFVILGFTGYRGVEYMDSTAFCGKTCHTVMEPEYTAYQHSAHARVSCTACHIGPGAGWFVKSKLSGSRQVLAVTFHTYKRPISTPIENLRPSRETCEQCHWPAKFQGDKAVVLTRYEQDEKNTALKTVLLLKVGGGSTESGFGAGIHWHTASKVEYRGSKDRKTIYWVQVQDPSGATREYWRAGAETKKDSILALPARRMECIDCHNRPTHAYELPGDALDDALKNGLIAPDLPYVKREAMRLMQSDYPSKQIALAGFADSLGAFYGRNYPQVAAGRTQDIAAAASAVRAIYARNIFPAMKIGWGTYPTMLGHRDDGGCFRCHDEQHSTADGKTISQDCSTCHNLLAMQEANPPILQSLYGGQ